MIKNLRALFASLPNRDGRDEPAKIEELIEEVTRDDEVAQARFAANAAERHEALLDGNDERLDELDREAARLSRAMERAQIALPDLRARLARANRDRDQERKRAMRAAALATKKKTKAALTKIERASLEIRAGLVEVAECEMAIEESNANLPDGEAPIVGLEQEVRGLPAIAPRVVDEKVEKVWVFRDWPEMLVESEKVRLIETLDGVHGVFRDPWARNTTDEIRVLKRRRIVRRVMPGVGLYQATPLAAEIRLPGLLPGAAPIWQPVGGPYMFGENRPQAVLAAAEELEAAAKGKSKDPRLLPEYADEQTEWIDLDPADADAAAFSTAGDFPS